MEVVFEARVRSQDGMLIPVDFRENGNILKRKLADFAATRTLDGVVTVKVTAPSFKRSAKQNAYLWGVVYPTILAFLKETQGTTYKPKELHEVMLAKFAPHKIKKVQMLGEEWVASFPFTSSEMDTAQFTTYIEDIRNHFAQVDCQIPEPTQ